MKLRQAQASATYLCPTRANWTSASLSGGASMCQQMILACHLLTGQIRTWAKKAQPGAAAYQGSVQVENKVTHYFTIRFRRGITADHEVVHDDISYRVKRVRI
jgi:hypothetical protein